MYEPEAEAARKAGFDIGLVDHETLVADQNAQKAVSANPDFSSPKKAVYRGWMVSVEEYAALHEALREKNIHLLASPSAYELCHHLPASFHLIEGHSPKSAWFPCQSVPSFEDIKDLLLSFGNSPIVIKDYVKSQKHYWEEACFIPNASEKRAVEKVVKRFCELQGADLAGGLVFRQFEEYQSMGTHSLSGMPLSIEYRLFVLNGRPLLSCPYWEEGAYEGQAPELSVFEDLLSRIESPFFTADFALRKDGEWRIVELGDGQVAGLPESCSAADFYLALSHFLLE